MHALEPAWEVLKREFDAANEAAARAARSQAIEELNRFVRRVKQYQTEGEWVSALLDSVASFAEGAAVFEIKNESAVLRGQAHLDLPTDLIFPFAAAAAFASAIETKDPVVALRSSSEVGEKLRGETSGTRVHVVPVLNGGRVAAVVFAVDGARTDTNALELIAGIASAVLERKSNSTLHAQIAETPKVEKPVDALKNTGELPAWIDLSEEQRMVHTRAQRFARVSVAQMQLSRPEACRAGREQSNLYLFLKKEIDKARDIYQKQFMTVPSMIDYLHLELVKTAAKDDEAKLGVEYPGQLG